MLTLNKVTRCGGSRNTNPKRDDKRKVNLTESSNKTSSHAEKFPLNYSLLKIPESRLLQSIFLRDGMFDFSTYQYPEGIDVNMLDFNKAGSNAEL